MTLKKTFILCALGALLFTAGANIANVLIRNTLDSAIEQAAVSESLPPQVVEKHKENIQDLQNLLNYSTGAESIFNILIVLILAYLGIHVILRPVMNISQAMTHLSEGKLSTEILGMGRKDEIGTMARALNVFKQQSIKINELNQLAKEQSEAHHQALEKQMKKLAESLEDAVTNVISSVQSEAATMLDHSVDMKKSASLVSTESNELIQAFHNSSSSFEDVAFMLETVLHGIQDISKQISHSNNITQEASQAARLTRKDIQNLDETAQEISGVVNIIKEVAEQTKLLALNATIEAARAGEAGKGFAVVAGEIKTLAKQTAEATVKITQQVKGIQKSVGISVKNITQITGTIEDIEKTSDHISQAMTDQESASRELTSITKTIADQNKESAEKALDMAGNSTRNAQLSDEVNVLAEDVSNQVEDLFVRLQTLLKQNTQAQRRYPRFTLQNLTCELSLEGKTRYVGVIDVSQKGAALQLSNHEDIPIGSLGTMTIPGFETLTIQTAGLHQDRLRVVFKVSQQVELNLLNFIKNHQKKEAV